MSTHVTCYDCGTERALDDGKRCTCGEPLWFPIAGEGFDWPDTRAPPGLWRYSDLLPVDAPSDGGLGVAAGGTPLIRAHRLDEYAGCRVFVKDEAENPTGSFKDRGSAVGVGYAAERGREWVGTVSHGNMAMSMSAHAASRGLDCAVLVPSDIPAGRLGLIAQYDPTLLKVSGDYGRLYYDTLALETAPPIEFVNSDTPLRVAGQKTTALEICESFAPDVPDAIVMPVSSGGHASAVWKGLCELATADVIDDLPRLYLVQAAACDPIARAYRNGEDRVTPVDAGSTIAFSIANASPPSGNRALVAAQDTDGAVISVPDAEIREATTRLASNAGLCAEPASATALAGLRRLTADGDVGSDEDVVAVVTGTGFKETSGTGGGGETATIDLGGLERELAEALRG